MRDAIVQLCCCAFYKAFLTDPIGSSQELTLLATIAIVGSVSSRQLLFHVHLISLKRERVRGMYDFIWSHVRSMTCVPATRDPLDPFGTCFASYLTKMLQRIRNVLEVTWRRCYNVSGTSCKLLEEDVTTYQERLASYLQKMLQRSRKSLLTTVPPLDGRRHQKHVYLVNGAITILKHMSSSMGRMTSHILWNIKNIWNHQPGIYIYVYTLWNIIR